MIYLTVEHIDGDRTTDTYQVEMRLGKFSIEIGPEFTTRAHAECLARKFKRLLAKEVSNMPKKKKKKKKVLGY